MTIRQPTTQPGALQDLYAPRSNCFGCGPENQKGLRLKSYAIGDEVVADFSPEAHHQAFGGVLSGGIIGTLLDCHANWTAAYHLMQVGALAALPCTVTAEFQLKLRRPTSLNEAAHIKAKIIETQGDRVIVEARMFSGGKETASFRGILVVVREGHPAFHKW